MTPEERAVPVARRSGGEALGLWLMAAPFVIGVLVLVVAPMLVTVVASVLEWDLIRVPRFVGLANFSELVRDDVFRISLRNSLQLAFTGVPIRLAAAVALALLLHRNSRMSSVSEAAVLVPSVIPDVAYALVWLWILNPLYGPLNQLLAFAGLPTPSWLSQPQPARWAVVMLWSFQLGEGFLIAVAARRHIPAEVYELAAEVGAGPLRTLRGVTLPLMAPALFVMALRDTALSFQAAFVPALIVTEGGPPPHATTYLSLFIYRNAFEYLRYGYAAAATVLLIVLTVAIAWLQFRLVDRWRQGVWF